LTRYVVDASAVAVAVTVDSPAAHELRRRLVGLSCDAPHLIDAELGSVVRRRVRSGAMTGDEGFDAVRAGWQLIDRRHPHAGVVAEAAWELRHNLSFYDALYVALAALLNVALLTADARLARAPGLPCEVEPA
jgi:predicted nucleic acid-binding protein